MRARAHQRRGPSGQGPISARAHPGKVPSGQGPMRARAHPGKGPSGQKAREPGARSLVYSGRQARSSSALVMTLTDDRAMAAAATMGDSRRPMTG